MDYLYGWQVSAVVMGGHDWFQASASAMGIPGVAGSDTGHDTDPADLRNIACRHVVGKLSVLCPQALDLVSLMMRGCEPRGNCTVSTFLCLDYVICCPVYKSEPLYGLDLSLLLKGLTLQRYPVPRAHPGPPIAGLHPRMDSDMSQLCFHSD